jgi:hypothetical protein
MHGEAVDPPLSGIVRPEDDPDESARIEGAEVPCSVRSQLLGERLEAIAAPRTGRQPARGEESKERRMVR